MPSSPSRQAELQRLAARPFAHRGLHGAGRIENSRAAFQAALDCGHGIELDVQASRDGEAFVFHDYDLRRLTGREGGVADLPSASLAAITLTGTDETIPPLPEILALVAGRGGLLIEVKAKGASVYHLCASVAAALEGYDGPVGVMSFNPHVGHWFARHRPAILRGMVVTEENKRGLRGAIERRLALWRARPDFLGYDVRDLPSRFAAACRNRGMPVMTWTVRTAAQRATAAAHADQIIYEDRE
ncbi:glycerophosphodiester phosphodiesterase family protein [Allosphingosinicella indica]|uniref:Glycerophosphoryl diester phosphodiesterase n=1 Tax=Allosphingosinicella indica TaxID=941907 RepID=A0A1X7FZK1_9SPHN|nr:glycerophosphodiester phosphodiesterase family protein [Allosphingosinicella indica]SMF61511.1 Glycerophosphoryl diester phosphodiesterase [Allosphingosinicella indica]